MHRLPPDLLRQAQNVLKAALRHCGSIAGFYVHGSVVLGGYTPGRSDLDILIINEASMSSDDRTAFADELLQQHDHPCPIELSVLTREGVHAHPPLCSFHFSSMWAPRYAVHDETNPLLHGDFPDEDIPSYLKLIRQSGICLYGDKASNLLPEVFDETFWHTISDGIEDYDLFAYDSFHSNLLTLPRIASFAYTRKILTKVQGAQWGIEQYPQFADLLTRAIDLYKNQTPHAFTQEELLAYKDFMIAEIRKGLR